MRRAPRWGVAAARRFSSNTNTATTTSTLQDPALVWAGLEQNREAAQACLNRPPEDTVCLDNDICPPESPLKSFEDFWKWRQWDFSKVQSKESQQEEFVHAQNLITHILADPISMAMLLPRTKLLDALQRKQENIDPEERQSRTFLNTPTQKALRICCVGARAEASLPTEYWKETLLLLAARTQEPQRTNRLLNLTIDFVGPEVLARPKIRHDCPHVGSITLRWLYQGTFHEFLQTYNKHKHDEGPRTLQPNYWDAFVLFNPGLGHDHLRDSWKPTLDVLLSSDQARLPLVLTAHSWKDAQRDGTVLTDYLLCRAPLYHPNPWGSRIQHQDPFDDSHKVHSSQYYHVIPE